MAEQANNHVLDANGKWVPMTQPSGGGGGGGGGDASAANQQTEIARLGDINTAVGQVKTSTDAVATGVADVNSGLDTVNVTVGAVKTSTDAVKASVDSGNTSLVDLLARVGQQSDLPPVSDTADSSIFGRLKRLTQRVTAIGVLPATLGVKTSAGSVSMAPASDAAFPQSAPRVASATIVSQTTAAVGTNFTAFAAQACTALNIVNTNPNAVDLEIRRGAAGNTLIVPAGSAYMMVGITNASDIQMRRQDTSNSQVAVSAEALA